ncbi:MAG: hypothetical protein KAR06_07710 [Deltaproteobacteria bacterium]|nr:hypothetical protein [Deltaproteobacteria bacterium]
MDTEILKNCPECGAEFYAHVVSCNTCNIELEQKDPFAPKDQKEIAGELKAEDQGLVPVDHGSGDRISELSILLRENGIECAITKEDGGKSCSSTCVLLTKPENSDRAVELIEQYWEEKHPEIKQAKLDKEGGKCPACGFIAGDAAECPDCGLFLGDTIEHDHEHSDDDCGSC